MRLDEFVSLCDANVNSRGSMLHQEYALQWTAAHEHWMSVDG